MTLKAMVDRAIADLTQAGIDDPRRDATILAGHALGLDRGAVFAHPDRPVAPAAAAVFEAMIARRRAREPVSRILGRRGFWTLDLAITPAVLDPRADSETLIEAVLAETVDRARPWRVLDLGTGSGCLLLALLSEWPAATGLGIDISAAALAVAQANAAAAGLDARASFARGDWATGLADGGFDIVVSNPPYIPSAVVDTLDPDVRLYDPRGALDGGADGLDAYRHLATEARRLLSPAGLLAVEIGIGQAAAVSDLFTAAGLAVAGVRRDLGGIERVVTAHTGR